MDHNISRPHYYQNGAVQPAPGDDQRSLLPEIAFIMGMTVLCLGLYYFFTHLQYFKLTRVQVAGNIRLSEAQIMDETKIHLGANLLSINLPLIEKRLLAHPWIAYTQVSRSLPSEFHIRIKEHQPLAIMDIGQKFIINIQGNIFKTWEEEDPKRLPVITGLKLFDMGLGEAPHTTAFNAVMNVLQFGMTPDSVLPNRIIKTIQVDREMGISLLIAPDTQGVWVNEIKLGFEEYSAKYQRLKYLFTYLKKQQTYLQIESIDLNNLDRVVVNPIRTESLARDYKEV